MKSYKILSVTAIILLFSVNSFSQNTDNTELKIKEPEREEFSRHWLMQVQAGVAHTVGEVSFGDLISPSVALNLGYQFSPSLGIRVGASGWEARGSWVAPRINYNYSFVQGNADAVLNFTNLLCGWKPNRFFNGYGFIGVGFNHAFDNDEAVSIAKNGYNLEYLWNESKNLVVGRAGLGADLRLNDYVSVGLEVNANILSDHFNSKKADNVDWHFNALIGVKVKFGRGYKTIPPIYYEPEPESEPEPEPKPVVEPVPEKKEPKEIVRIEIEPMQYDVFFSINSAKIRVSEQEKVEQLVAFMKQHSDAKVQITGYADKATGNAVVNMRISQKRAQAVANALQDAGISVERITTDAKGDTVQPYNGIEQNRVSICIAEIVD